MSWIDRFGGVLPAIKKGFFQQEIANSAYRYQTEIENKDRTIVGVNEYLTDEATTPEPLRISKQSYEKQVRRLKNLRKTRNNRKVKRALAKLEDVAEGKGNTMHAILEAVRAYATLGEVCSVLRDVFGTWREPLLY